MVGGDRNIQVREILNLSKFLEKELSNSEVEGIANQLFGGTSTFKKGHANDWKNHFSASLLKRFYEKEDGLVEFLGY